ncbi:hypothetical protein LJC07_06605 [Christensenellaceae bacterium OttesenSCG-928-L17]|nr:hypothetical protein [Christensenellaceae bacterium OttesenSCG-928-L17]
MYEENQNPRQHYNQNTSGLIPFEKGEYSPHRHIKKKGEISRKRIVKELLASKMNPNLLLTPQAKAMYEAVPNATYLSAVILNLINQSLGNGVGSVHAANALLKIVQQVEDKEIPDDSFFAKDRTLEIITISGREEVERLEKMEKALEEKYGKDYKKQSAEDFLDMDEGF